MQARRFFRGESKREERFLKGDKAKGRLTNFIAAEKENAATSGSYLNLLGLRFGRPQGAAPTGHNQAEDIGEITSTTATFRL